jgi:hypothetical protein
VKGSDNQIIIGYIGVAAALLLMVISGSFWWLIALFFMYSFAHGATVDRWFYFPSLSLFDHAFGETGDASGGDSGGGGDAGGGDGGF